MKKTIYAIINYKSWDHHFELNSRQQIIWIYNVFRLLTKHAKAFLRRA